jgi:hypothetical protein
MTLGSNQLIMLLSEHHVTWRRTRTPELYPLSVILQLHRNQIYEWIQFSKLERARKYE